VNGVGEVKDVTDAVQEIAGDVNDDGNDLLGLPYHPSYVRDENERRRRENKWGAPVEAFHTADRQTDRTMILVVAPPHSKTPLSHTEVDSKGPRPPQR